MKTIIYLVVFLSFVTLVNAQQVGQLSLRVFDPIVYNPAVAGSNSYPEIKLHHRSQWLGFEGAPMTSLFTYHNEAGGKLGIGGYILNDMYGAYRKSALNVSLAYHLPLNGFYWSFGLGANAMQLALDGKKATIHELDDNSFATGLSDKMFEPDASFGTYIYNRNFFIGISVLQLMGMKAKMDFNNNLGAIIPLTQHYYISGGYTFVTSKKTEIEPSILISNAVSSPVQIDFNLKMEFKNKITTGLSYRHGDAAVLMLGYRISRYFIGYSYDITISKFRKTNSGSHEIVFAFNWPFTQDTKPMYDLKGTSRGQLKKRFK